MTDLIKHIILLLDFIAGLWSAMRKDMKHSVKYHIGERKKRRGECIGDCKTLLTIDNQKYAILYENEGMMVLKKLNTLEEPTEKLESEEPTK